MTHLPTITLGDGLAVSALGYGAMGLSDVYGPAEERQSLATLRHALDQGVTLIDTADVYGAGGNERLVGRLLAERGTDRAGVTVAGKFGIVLGGSGTGTDGTVDTSGMTTRGDGCRWCRSRVRGGPCVSTRTSGRRRSRSTRGSSDC
ncbi:aldo/keto reductase [Streptomyces sp. NPDC088400]|uniref:aldo/keto reductase n=1 Tax=Streptomyces sp. NPDC088400 TaxID=3365861 RepID=UPI003800B6A7